MGPVVAELRDGQGALTETLVASPQLSGHWDRCDPSLIVIGSLVSDRGNYTVVDRSGRMSLRMQRSSAKDADFDNVAGPRLRVHADPGELRVLRPDGVPFGSITTLATTGSTTDPEISVRDASSRVVGHVERQARGAVFLDAGSVSRRAAIPAATASDQAAVGLLGIPGLTDEERSALYLLWSR